MLYVHAHYFNKAHFASCDCSIKRIVDDLGSVVKLMFLHKGIRDAGLDNSEVTAGPPPSSPSALLSASNGLDESAAECGPLEHASVINHTRQTALFCKVFH